jgi:hypothetical protein
VWSAASSIDLLIAIMRCVLLAFSLGIAMLQQQASLPWHATCALVPVVVAIGCVVYSSRAGGAPSRIARAAALLVAAFSVGVRARATRLT